jgi:WD40 repeat protein
MEYSPDGSKLAVGSHDNNIYVYSTSNYSLLGVCSKHNSFITSVDWSLDGSYIRSVCGAYELLFFDGNSFKQDPNGPSNTRGTQWATNNAKFGWLVDGIFPTGTDGSHVNYVDFSKDGLLIASGDDYGLVNIFRNPCRKGHKAISLRGHSEHVVRVSFGADD